MTMPLATEPIPSPLRELPLYQALADELRGAMNDGRLTPGARLPSVREAARSRTLSINTVLAAYRHLESCGLVEARPQAGYFVRARLASPPPPGLAVPPGSARTAKPAVLSRITRVVAAQSSPDTIDLSLATPRGGDLYPGEKLSRLVSEVARRQPSLVSDYSLPPGPIRLRREICRHAADLGMTLAAEDILLTNGCMEALQLALRAVTRPGDAIALESPTYFNLIPLADRLGLKTIEVPTHPDTGMSLEALELLLSEERVQAVVCMPTVHNPLGTSMPIAGKKRLAELANQYRVPVIEDALYAELQYTTPLQPAVKSFDRGGWVILCSSYTKTLAPGLRVGWMEGGRFQRDLAELKFCSSVAQPALIAEALGLFLESGGYAHHLRRLRRAYTARIDRLRGLIDTAFPAGTRATLPTGGFLVWVALPEGCNADALFDAALAHNISITPGNLYSPSGRYTRHIRLSGCHAFSDRHVHALMTLGALAARQCRV